MLQFLKSKLNSPYPSDFHWKDALIRASIFGCFVASFLWYFKPFGFGSLESLGAITITFGLITWFCIILNAILLPKIASKYFDEDKWTIGKEIIYTIYNTSVIGYFNALFIILVFEVKSHNIFEIIMNLQFATFAVGALPVIFFALYDQNKLLRENLLKANSLSQKINNHQPTKISSSVVKAESLIPKVDFHAENGNLELSISPSDLLFVKSEGNYLEVHFIESANIQKSLIRNTLKYVENILEGMPFFRCHRSYLVNTQQISSVSGNARGYEISLQHTAQTVPVSRAKTKQLEMVLD